MVKICAVGDCKGGSAAAKSERELRGVRQLALFKVPKSEEDRRQWVDLLQTPLNNNSVVCEQHFSKEDVQTADSFILEGCRAVLPRLRCTLRRGALPLLRIIDDQTSSAGDSAAVEENTVGCPDDAAPVVVNEVVGMTIGRLKTILIETPLPPTWCWCQSNEKIVFTQIDPFTPKIKLFIDIQADLSIIVSCPNGLEFMNLKFPSLENARNCATKPQRGEKKFLAFSNDRNLGTTLLYAVRSPDNLAKVDLGRKAETMACIFDIMKTSTACNGAGVTPRSRSVHCRVLILEGDYKRSTAAPRCLCCRKLRIKTLKKRQRSSSNIKVRYDRCKREVYHQQRQYQRLLKKIDRVANVKYTTGPSRDFL